MKNNLRFAALLLIAFLATWHSVRFYLYNTTFYLDWPRYLAGTERMPFQARLLPALLIKPLLSIDVLHTAVSGHGLQGGPMSNPAMVFLMFLDIAAVMLTGYLGYLLYNYFSEERKLAVLIYPAFLTLFVFSYAIHFEQNFSYPYDVLSGLFFTLGLLCIAREQYLALLAVVLVGTLNRESTMFLVAIYALDHIHKGRVNVRAALRIAVLGLAWFAVYASLQHYFRGNDQSETVGHIRDNIRAMRPNQWPALTNIAGYVPLVLLLYVRKLPSRFASWLYVLPLWFIIMFAKGLIIETRVYGELSCYAAVGCVLLVEKLAGSAYNSTREEAPSFS